MEHKTATLLTLNDGLKLDVFDHDCFQQKRPKHVFICFPIGLKLNQEKKMERLVSSGLRQAGGKKLMQQGSCLDHTPCYGKEEQRERER